MKVYEAFVRKVLKRPYKLTKRYDAGAGKPVVLLHGIASSSAIWQPLYETDHEGLRLIALDLLGFGQSPKPDWIDYSVDDHAMAVVASLKKSRIKGPITLLGHSMGCLVATHIAYTYPKLVSQLVLYQPPLLASQTGNKRYNRRKTAYVRAFGYIASRQELVLNYSKYVGQRNKRKGTFLLDKEGWIPFERSMRNTIMRQNAYDQLRTLSMKTDIIYGTKDRLVIRTAARKLFEKNNHVELHTISEVHGLSAHSATFLANLLKSA